MAELNVTLRAGARDDVEAVKRLLDRSWLTTWAPELPLAAVARFAAQDGARAYVEAMVESFELAVAPDGRIVGMLHLHGDELSAMHVDPAFQGLGVGRVLLDRAEAALLDRSAQPRLEVDLSNTRALAIYRRRGWREVRRFVGDECGAPVEIAELVLVAGTRVISSGKANSSDPPGNASTERP
ncbi:GNAT family N-acetyltransferase [Bosea eneae]|uniref:GNAT family N-acetyltransferase n=1 Tax=Bosea eneae TaxID=151454 RepID=A0ABW0J030_9HYPH